MQLVVILIVPFACWMVSELSDSRRWLRLTLGLITLILIGVTAYGFASLDRFNLNAYHSGTLKDLTNSLVEITAKDYDPEQLRRNLIELDKSTMATYETWQPNEEAVQEFLKRYEIESLHLP